MDTKIVVLVLVLIIVGVPLMSGESGIEGIFGYWGKLLNLSLTEKEEFELSFLVLSEKEVFVGEKVEVKIGVRNMGNTDGVYNAVLTVDGDEVESMNISLSEGEYEEANFSIVEDTVGDYTVQIGGLMEILKVKPKLLDAGDFIEYEITGAIGGQFGGMEVYFIERIEVKEVTQGGYTVSVTASDQDGMIQGIWNGTVGLYEIIGPRISEERYPRKNEMTLVDVRRISTSIGWRSVEFFEIDSQNLVYIEKFSYVVLRESIYMTTDEGYQMQAECDVYDTNIDWM